MSTNPRNPTDKGVERRGLERLASDLGCEPAAAAAVLQDAGVSIGPSGVGGEYQTDHAGRALEPDLSQLDPWKLAERQFGALRDRMRGMTPDQKVAYMDGYMLGLDHATQAHDASVARIQRLIGGSA